MAFVFLKMWFMLIVDNKIFQKRGIVMIHGINLGGKERKRFLVNRGFISCGYCAYHRKENASGRRPMANKYKNINRESIRTFSTPINKEVQPDICPFCNAGILQIEVKSEEFHYKGQLITIPGYCVYRCISCGDASVDNDTLRESGKILKDFQLKVDGLESFLVKEGIEIEYFN